MDSSFRNAILEQNDNCRRWRKPTAQLGEKMWFQGIFVGHHDRTRATSYIAKSGIVRGKSWTKPMLSDAWEPMNLEDWFGDLWHMVIRSHMVITETRLTKKFITDEERA